MNISEVEDADTAMFEGQNEHCAQAIISEFEDARTQKVSSESNTVVINAEIHAENTDAQHIVQDFSDSGSLITQAPQSQSIHATINALSTWVSAIQPRESWYLAGWIGDSPIDFLVDPGAVVSAISLQSYEKLMKSNAIITPMRAMHLELEAANKSDMRVHGMCNLELSVHGLIINIDAVVVDLNCHAILGMDILGDASKLPFILDLVKGTLSGGGYETIQLHRFQTATECFAETSDSVCIPPHSEVMLWAKLKTNNGRKGPTAGVVLALQTFVQEFGLLVGRSLVRADADDWKIPILIYNSVHNETSKLHMQPSYNTSTHTHSACRGNPGDPTYRLSGDRSERRRGRATTTFDRCARCSNRINEQSACARSCFTSKACEHFPSTRNTHHRPHGGSDARH